jgi:hypothetical protein
MRDEGESTTPLRLQLTLDVLERDKDCGDATVIAACRRVIQADRLGWRRHGNPHDLRLVLAFAEEGRLCPVEAPLGYFFLEAGDLAATPTAGPAGVSDRP